MKKYLSILRIFAVVIVAALAWSLRMRAVDMLPNDYDEDDYLRAAQEYAAVIQSGDWSGFSDYNYRTEHPPLSKIAMGFAIAGDPQVALVPDRPTTAEPDKYLPKPQLTHARTINAVFGTLTVLALAILNPLAGLLLATHTFTIKYVSQVMLEGLPSLTSLLAALFYLRNKKAITPRSAYGWLALSALFLGLTAAAKYLYAVIGFVILIDWYLANKDEHPFSPAKLAPILAWGLLAVAVFFLFDPYLWPDPIGRLKESVFYHAGYSTGAAEVQRANFPFWQQFVWLNTGAYMWHEDVFLAKIDPFILVLSFFGLSRLWKREKLFVLWLAVQMGFLILWPTKWPQYVVTLTVPLSFAAAEGFFALIVEPLRNWYKNRSLPKSADRNQFRQALPWLIPGLLAFTAFTIIPLLFQVGVSLTDFNTTSLKDAFQQGGLWRALWGGLTGQEPIKPFDLETRSNQVNFIGLNSYWPVFTYIGANGILVFDFIWTVLSVSLQTALGLGAALLLWQRGLKFGKFWQAIFIIPWAIPEMIGALMWFNIFLPDNGWLALADQQYGKEILFLNVFNNWNHTPNLWLLVFLIPAIWYGFPFMMLAASAGLKMLPEDVYDAAAMDGANGWQTFRHVTLPLLLPLLIPAIIVRGIFAFNQFYLFQAFYFTDSTLATLSYNIFNPSGGFGGPSGLFAVSAVINILNVIVLIALVAIFNRWSKAGEGVTYA